MSDSWPVEENPSSFRRLVARTVGTLAVALLIGYPLSLGPAIYFMETRYSRSDPPLETVLMFDKVYTPLKVVAVRTPGLTAVFSNYLSFWRDLAKKRNDPQSN